MSYFLWVVWVVILQKIYENKVTHLTIWRSFSFLWNKNPYKLIGMECCWIIIWTFLSPLAPYWMTRTDEKQTWQQAFGARPADVCWCGDEKATERVLQAGCNQSQVIPPNTKEILTPCLWWGTLCLYVPKFTSFRDSLRGHQRLPMCVACVGFGLWPTFLFVYCLCMLAPLFLFEFLKRFLFFADAAFKAATVPLWGKEAFGGEGRLHIWSVTGRAVHSGWMLPLTRNLASRNWRRERTGASGGGYISLLCCVIVPPRCAEPQPGSGGGPC